MFSLTRQWVPRLASYPEREIDDCTTIIMHRSGPWKPPYDVPTDGEDVAVLFQENDFGTARKMPYQYVVGPHGVYECVPWWRISPHAAEWNDASIGVAILADLRREAPSETMYDDIIGLVQWLETCVDAPLDVCGHTDLPGATSDPTKICPGDKLDLDFIRNGGA